MPEASTLGIFVAAAIVFLVVPGPAVIYVTARSMDQGRAAGMASVLGIHTGTVIHTAAAALGLSALLTSSAAAYSTVKLLGAAYLVFSGSAESWFRSGSRTSRLPPAGVPCGGSTARASW